VSAVSSQPFFREFAVRLSRRADEVISTMAEGDVLAGLSVATLAGGEDPSVDDGIEHVLLVAVTERRTKEEIDRYVELLKEALKR
jgi:glycine dehydrogenase subunit 1